jgi:hypothetical protein
MKSFFESFRPPQADDSIAAGGCRLSSPTLLRSMLLSPPTPALPTSSHLAETMILTATLDSIDTVLAHELNRMSFQEREGISEEIHGVHSMAVKETPDFVHEKLMALEQALQKIPDQDKGAYSKAMQLQSPYVINVVQLRLPILRAEVFDVKKAALRMVKFLDLAYDLCGEDGLMRPMNLSDFSTEDMRFLRQGFFQMLGSRDRTGRRVMGHFADIPTNFPVRNRVRTNSIVYCGCDASASDMYILTFEFCCRCQR